MSKLYGDGKHDDFVVFQEMLNKGGKISVPKGDYCISGTLIIKSNTELIADAKARFFMSGDRARKRGEFLLSTDPKKKNVNISICGGIWDGNNLSELIKKADIFDKQGYSGAVLNFVSVNKLKLDGLTIINPAAYYARFNVIDHFEINNIVFKSEIEQNNQDGLHFCGEVRNGSIENIRAETVGQTNDDLIAFNADDCIDRVENLDMVNGDIENIKVKNIFAEDCHTFIRLLSVNSEIRNIKIDNVSGGVRCFAINMDAARYCRTPLFEDENRPRGVGCIENVEISNMNVHWTERTASSAMILCETQADNLVIKDFNVDRDIQLENKSVPVLLVKNIYKRVLKTSLGKSIMLYNKCEKFQYSGNIKEFSILKL